MDSGGGRMNGVLRNRGSIAGRWQRRERRQTMARKSGDARVGVQEEGKITNEGWAFGTLHKEGTKDEAGEEQRRR